MGQVWEGRHVVTDMPVAIKFLVSERADDPVQAAAMEAEARAIARLAHPRVVQIYEVGVVPEGATIPGLPTGSPYIVMDWVPHSVADFPRPLPWETTRAVVLEILDALAHVHARGIVHRDIKPSNILGRLGRLRLADFGISRQRDEAPREGSTSATGTPYYMAPEQFVGSAGGVGSWTDLYAVGCLTFLLCTGRFPFEGNSVVALAVKHTQSPFPADDFVPELADWFRNITAKNPMARYEFAAEAARDLARIESAYDDASGAPTERWISPGAAATEAFGLTTILLEHDSELPDTAPRWRGAISRSGRAAELPDWRSGEANRQHVEHLRGAGLAVAVMRYPRFFGRTEQRDEMWASLRRCVLRGESSATVIVGPVGSGRTRLAKWLIERAHELGVARHVGPVDCAAEQDPFGRLVREDLEIGADDHELTVDRVDRQMQPTQVHVDAERNAIVRWLTGRLDAAGPRDRLDAIRAALALCARETPLIVVLDHVDQASAEVLQAVHHLVRTEIGSPLHVVMTASSLLPDPRGVFRQIELGPLENPFIDSMVQSLAPLHPELAARVVEVADGNPGHAITLIRGLVERDELRAGSHGYELISHVDLRLGSMKELWNDRLEQLVREIGTARSALEAAAALAGEVKHSDWQAVCSAGNTFLPDGLHRELDRRGFARRTKDGWVFADATLRDLIVEGAHLRNTWKSHIAACMQVLPDADVERRAFWEFEAGAYGRAARDFLQAARRAERMCEYSRATQLVTRAEASAQHLDAPDAQRFFTEAKLLKASVWGLDRIDDANAIAQEAARCAERHGWEDLAAAAYEQLAKFARKRVDLELAAQLYEKSRRAFEAVEDPRGVGQALQGLGMVSVARGELGQAEEQYNEALGAFLPVRDLRGAAWAANGLGDVYRKLERLDLAESWYSRALKWFETIGHGYGAMWCLHDLAQTRRAAGDLAGAETGYEQTVQYAQRLGQRVVAPRLNLGIVRVQRGDYSSARSVFEEVVEESRLRSVTGEEGIARICLLACDAAVGRWDAVGENLRLGRDQVGSLIDADLGAMADVAASYARKADQQELADQLTAFSRVQLGRPAEPNQAR